MTGAGTTQACAACKYQRRKCAPDCPLSPYFPPDQPKRFHNVHRLFGVSNILRILKLVDPSKREDAVKSIVYEADTREKDPVHGCLGVISVLQSQIVKLKEELAYAREQLYLLEQQQQHSAFLQQHLAAQQQALVAAGHAHAQGHPSLHAQGVLGMGGSLSPMSMGLQPSYNVLSPGSMAYGGGFDANAIYRGSYADSMRSFMDYRSGNAYVDAKPATATMAAFNNLNAYGIHHQQQQQHPDSEASSSGGRPSLSANSYLDARASSVRNLAESASSVQSIKDTLNKYGVAPNEI